MIVSVTGHSGSGKSTLAKMMAKHLNCTLIDVDKIVFNMYSNDEVCKKLHSAFGDVVLDKNGKVCKNLVGKSVFNNIGLMETLNNLTWSYLENEIDFQISKNENVVLDYKFLPITKYHSKSNFNILVEAVDDNLRLNRIVARDNVSIEYAKQRENFSPKFSEFNFDFVIQNDYSTNFEKECLLVIEKIKGSIL